MIRKVVIEGGVVIGSGVIVVGPGGGIWYRYTRHIVERQLIRTTLFYKSYIGQSMHSI